MNGGNDPRLAAALRRRLGRRVPVAAAAVATASGPGGTAPGADEGTVVTAERAAVAVLGAAPGADFEIGSISKGVTGLLYADAQARGEVTAGTRLGELLPLGDAPAAATTLSALSVHCSGLPSLPASAHPWRRTASLMRHGTNPYGEDLDVLIEQARGVRLRGRRPRYSNFGFELLGHALASAAATTYADLVAERLAAPLRLDPWYIAATPAELRPDALTGTDRRGRPRQPWTGAALGPAGGIRASAAAMGRFTAALLDGTAPGTTALDPVRAFAPGLRIGAAWMTMRAKGREITWHNGATGGFRAWIGLDRAAGLGVAVLAATNRPVDGCGLALLHEYRTGRR